MTDRKDRPAHWRPEPWPYQRMTRADFLLLVMVPVIVTALILAVIIIMRIT
jgi:hypothetical protein